MSEDPVADEPAEIEEGEILFDEAGGSWWVVAIGPVMIAAVLIMEIVGGGAILRPVSNVTVAGNFTALMKGVAALGSDLKYALPQDGYYAAPSVLVEKLTVAGN